MPRGTAINAGLTLPPPRPEYDEQDQRETRRLIERFAQQQANWEAVINTPVSVTAIAGLTGAADMVPYFTGVSAMALASLTPYARTILAAASASDARTLLGLGSLAVLSTVTETNITLADVTTLNASTTKHGLVPKLPNDATKYYDGTGNFSVPAGGGSSAGAYPLTNATDGLIFRWNATLGTKTLDAKGYVNKIFDLSGAGHDSTTNTTNPPKWIDNGFLGRYPGLFFDFNMKLMVSLPQLPAPLACTIIFVLQGAESSGNSHIYNYAGNPIGFGATTPLDFMYNGTLPAVHPMSNESNTHVVPTLQRYPAVGIHVYNGAASVQSINGNEVVVSPGTIATGTTNLFTIGSDSSSGVGGGTAQTCRMVLAEIAVVTTAISAAKRALVNAYYKALYSMSFNG